MQINSIQQIIVLGTGHYLCRGGRGKNMLESSKFL